MKDITKLIRRFVGILLLSTVLVIVLNIIILAAISASQTANGRPWTTAKETAEALQETETGYVLSGDMTERLSGENAWAIYIDNDTLEVKWHNGKSAGYRSSALYDLRHCKSDTRIY